MKEFILEKIIDIQKKYEITYISDPFTIPDWKSSPEYKELMLVLKSENLFSIFDGKMQYIGSSGARVELENLADWIIKKSSILEPSAVIENLYKYIVEEEFEAKVIMLLSGLHTEDNFKISDNISIVRPTAINNMAIQLSLFRADTSLLPLPRIDSILQTTIKHKKNHVDDSEHRFTAIAQDTYIKLNDIRLLFSLLPGNRGPQALAFSIIVEDHIPALADGAGWSLCSFRNTVINQSLIKIEANKTNSLYQSFLKRTDKEKAKLRIVLRNLANFKCTNDIVQRSIDLRTCLESLFLDDGNKQELRFRLSLRAALFEGNIRDKEDMSKLFKKAYDITSTAVHTGHLSDKKIEETHIVFPAITDKVNNVITYILEHGNINWQKSELQGKVFCM